MLLRGLAVAVVLVTSSFCMAQGTSDLLLGYSYVDLDGDGGLDGASGVGVATRLSAPLAPFEMPQLRLNMALGLNYYSGDAENGGDDPDLFLGKIEWGPSWKQYFGNFFLEPGVAGVLMLGRYDGGSGGIQYKGGYGIQPGIRLGWSVPRMHFGIDAHYMLGRLRFRDGVGGNMSEMFVGGFIGWRW